MGRRLLVFLQTSILSVHALHTICIDMHCRRRVGPIDDFSHSPAYAGRAGQIPVRNVAGRLGCRLGEMLLPDGSRNASCKSPSLSESHSGSSGVQLQANAPIRRPRIRPRLYSVLISRSKALLRRRSKAFSVGERHIFCRTPPILAANHSFCFST